MKGIVFAVVVVVVCFVGVGATQLEAGMIAYNSTTNQSLSAEEWCGCMKGAEQVSDKERSKMRLVCVGKFNVSERFLDYAYDIENQNCTGILTDSATTTESVPTSTTSDPSTTLSPVFVQNESTTPAATTENEGVSSGRPADFSTTAASNDNDTLTSQGTTIRITTNDGVSVGTESTEKVKPETEAEGSNHLYWTLPLICVLLLAMLIGGFLIFRYTKKAGYLQQPAKSTVNGDSTKKTTEGGV